MKTERLIRRHIVQGADGRDVELLEYQEFVTVSDRNGTTELPGMKRLATADGRSVNFIERGRYEVVQTDEMLTSDSPDAPGEDG